MNQPNRYAPKERWTRYEAVVWDKAEHWTFDVVVFAMNDTEALRKLVYEYPRRGYSVRSITPRGNVL